MFEIMPNSKTYTFTVDKERQYAIKVLNVISNLKQNWGKELWAVIKLNKV